MQIRKSRSDTHVEKTENLVKYLLRKRKESIQNSLVRPLYQEALKSLFLVMVLLVDTFVPLEGYRIVPFPFNVIIALILLGILVYIEIRFYNSVWGKKGKWSIEKYKQTISKNSEEKKT
jgi:ABC-type xylose transport system permease subunit